MTSSLALAEIDLAALGHNVREMRRLTDSRAQLMAVVKANAYGHGILPVSRKALANGADRLGVARIEEGIAIRKGGLDAPVLVLGYTPPARAEDLTHYHLDQAVFSVETARAYSAATKKCAGRIRLHIKIDTGMGRLGIMASELAKGLSIEDPVRQIGDIMRLPGIDVEGIFTHFATADSMDRSSAYRQFVRFMDLLEQLRRGGMEIPVRHAANSAATIFMSDTHLDMVRTGISLYGLYPSEEMPEKGVDLRPVMTVKSRVVHVKSVPAGFPVSYGETYKTSKPTRIATVPLGYADGFNRNFSNRGTMLVRGRRAPVVGRVCMDLSLLDVGHLPDVCMEDEVVVMGRQGTEFISADELASCLGTIHYEVICAITDRVPRVYLDCNPENE